MALKLNKPKPAEATVTTENKTKGEVTSSTSEGIDTTELQGTALSTLKPVADIGFGLSYTHNLGDFKSTRVGNQPQPARPSRRAGGRLRQGQGVGRGQTAADRGRAGKQLIA